MLRTIEELSPETGQKIIFLEQTFELKEFHKALVIFFLLCDSCL